MYLYYLLLALVTFVDSASSKCNGHHHHQAGSVQHRKTAITNVLVWDGTKFPRSRSTVVIVDGIISNENSVGAVIINGKGGFLIPGLIDSHVRLTDCAYLGTMQKYGVTTALDMGTTPFEAVAKCSEHGVTDIRGSGAAGTVNGTKISFIPGFPSDSFIPTPDAGRAFVASRKAEGVDYIKLFLDPSGPDDETIKAVSALLFLLINAIEVDDRSQVVKAAHQEGLQVIAHASSYAAYAQAARTGVDIITHAPIDKALDDAVINDIISRDIKVVPTLLMMQVCIRAIETSPYTNSTDCILSVHHQQHRGPFLPLRQRGTRHEISPRRRHSHCCGNRQ